MTALRLLLAAVAVACLTATGVLLATAPAAPKQPRPIVRVATEHRTVVKRLPRRVKVRRVYVDTPAPAPSPSPAPAAPHVVPATYAAPQPAAAPVVRTYRAPAPAPTPVRHVTAAPRPVAAPTNAQSLHDWEESHHRDAPNHDQLEHQGGGDD